MQKMTHHMILLVIVLLFFGRCANVDHGKPHEAQSRDTVYTAMAAMNVFAVDPERALAIIDSGLLVGNIEADEAQQILLELLESEYTKDLVNRENAAQAWGFLARAYANLGETETARHYVDLFEQSDYGKTLSGRSMIARSWCLLGDYDKMLATYDEVKAKMGGDTINNEYAEMLYGYAQAADASGDLNASIGYWQRYSELNRLLNEQLLKSRAYEYVTRYQLQEERMNTLREQAKAQNNRNLAVAGFILALVAVGFIVWLLIQRRAINRKNCVLVEQIAETLKYKKISEELEVRSEESGMKSEELENADEQLFRQLSGIIRRERLFTNPNFGRQMLVDRFHLTEHRIGAAFSHGGSLPDFIRELRLEYACQLLTDHPEMSIGDVAAASGFSSLSVFSREFKRKLDVTPSYYRDQRVSNIDKTH